MARASQIQMMAKQMGGRKKAEEAFRAYMKQMEKAQKKEGKAGRWGDIGGIGMSLLAAGLSTGAGPLGMLAMGALKGGMGGIGKELGYKLGGGGKGLAGPDFSKFSSSPYGRAYAKELFQKSGDMRSLFQDTLAKPGEFVGKGALAGLFSAAPGAIAEAGLFGDKSSIGDMFLKNREGISPAALDMNIPFEDIVGEEWEDAMRYLPPSNVGFGLRGN